MEIKIDNRFIKKLKGAVEQYEFQIGVENKSRKGALGAYKHGLTYFAGDIARKKSRKEYGDNQEIAEKFSKRYDIFRSPFTNKQNKDILNFVDSFFRLITGRSKVKRLTNLLQAIIRNPILRLDYGHNSEKAIKRKTFDRLMIDTGQWFSSIKARVKRRGVIV